MNCPHLELCFSLTSCQTINQDCFEFKSWTCQECKSEESPWLCVHCHAIHCGRYVNGHAKSHFEMHKSQAQLNLASHCIQFHCLETSVYCYLCDEFVINDTSNNLVQDLRNQVNVINRHIRGTSDGDSEDVSSSAKSSPSPDEAEMAGTSALPGDACHVIFASRISLPVSDVCDHKPESPSESAPNQEMPVECAGSNDNGSSIVVEDSSNEAAVFQVLPIVQSHSNVLLGGKDSFLPEEVLIKGGIEEVDRELPLGCGRSVLKRKNKVLGSVAVRKKKKEENCSKVKPQSSGLRNLGNTCFMNAVLQSLSNIQSFCGYIKRLPSFECEMSKRAHQTRKITKEGRGEAHFLVEELRKTLICLWENGKTSISPDALFQVIWKVVPRFRGYQQQDAHEFMRYLLDRLHTELLMLLPYPDNDSSFIGTKGKNTIVTSIFGGLLQSEVNCMICKTESKKHDPFLDLSLDIPSCYAVVAPLRKKQQPAGNVEVTPPVPSCRLQDCLESFTELEELEETELYMCSSCKLKQRSTKRLWIRQLPNVLCLHVKRFRWDSFLRSKLDTHVRFPLEGLDMTPFLLNGLHATRTSGAGENLYNLAAVIVHHGNGAGSGHYTSYAVCDGVWYHFNDSTVSSCSEETVLSCKAYILFYVRKNLKLPEYMVCPRN